MPMRRVGGWVAGILVVGLLVAGAGLGARGAIAADDDRADFSADDLGDPTEEGSILQMLEPEEREALARSQMTGIPPEPAKPAKPDHESLGDKIGKLGVSIATVAISVGAVVAPFFLF